jgi:murein tripeptide amidase MpaA
MTPEAILPPAVPWSGASERLVAPARDPWITPAERTGLTATPSYDETIAWLQRLDAASPLIRMERFGRTAQGRDLWVVIAGRGGTLDPAKPTVLAQAGIHAGEIDGKDAGLMLLRDIAFRGKAGLLDGANLLFVPVFNADGHERTSPYNRPNQRGPVNQGWRTTAQNLNLNRDYAKADSPEMRAMIGLIRRHRPHLYLDLHVTDGVDHQHDITYAFEAWDGIHGRSKAGGAWLERRLRPALDAALSAAGHVPGPYIDAVDPRAPEKGISIAPSPPRFSTGYGDAIRLPTVLVETHSLKPYRQRVLGTYVLIEQSLKSAAAHGAELRSAVVSDLRTRPDQIVVSWKPLERPVGTFRFRPVSRETYTSPASGREEVRWTGRPLPAVDAPVFSAEPGVTVRAPRAYWVPATKPEVIERLRVHGIQMEVLTAPRTVGVERLRLPDAKLAPAASEGRVPMTAGAPVRESARETYPTGSVRVPVDQPLGELAVLLLEPQSDDSLFAWGFFPEILQRTEYIEGYSLAPLAERMLAADPRLRAEFEAALRPTPSSRPTPMRGWPGSIAARPITTRSTCCTPSAGSCGPEPRPDTGACGGAGAQRRDRPRGRAALAPAQRHGVVQGHHPGQARHHGPQDLGQSAPAPAARAHQHRAVARGRVRAPGRGALRTLGGGALHRPRPGARRSGRGGLRDRRRGAVRPGHAQGAPALSHRGRGRGGGRRHVSTLRRIRLVRGPPRSAPGGRRRRPPLRLPRPGTPLT